MQLPRTIVEGWSAYWHDLPQSSCPILYDTRDQDLWMIGWEGGKEVESCMRERIMNMRKHV